MEVVRQDLLNVLDESIGFMRYVDSAKKRCCKLQNLLDSNRDIALKRLNEAYVKAEKNLQIRHAKLEEEIKNVASLKENDLLLEKKSLQNIIKESSDTLNQIEEVLKIGKEDELYSRGPQLDLRMKQIIMNTQMKDINTSLEFIPNADFLKENIGHVKVFIENSPHARTLTEESHNTELNEARDRVKAVGIPPGFGRSATVENVTVGIPPGFGRSAIVENVKSCVVTSAALGNKSETCQKDRKIVPISSETIVKTTHAERTGIKERMNPNLEFCSEKSKLEMIAGVQLEKKFVSQLDLLTSGSTKTQFGSQSDRNDNIKQFGSQSNRNATNITQFGKQSVSSVSKTNCTMECFPKDKEQIETQFEDAVKAMRIKELKCQVKSSNLLLTSPVKVKSAHYVPPALRNKEQLAVVKKDTGKSSVPVTSKEEGDPGQNKTDLRMRLNTLQANKKEPSSDTSAFQTFKEPTAINHNINNARWPHDKYEEIQKEEKFPNFRIEKVANNNNNTSWLCDKNAEKTDLKTDTQSNSQLVVKEDAWKNDEEQLGVIRPTHNQAKRIAAWTQPSCKAEFSLSAKAVVEASTLQKLAKSSISAQENAQSDNKLLPAKTNKANYEKSSSELKENAGVNSVPNSKKDIINDYITAGVPVVKATYMRTVGTGRQGRDPDNLNFPIGVTVNNSHNRLIICDNGQNLVKVFHWNGDFLFLLDAKEKFARPSAVLCDKDDNVFIKDDFCIRKFSHDGTFLKKFGQDVLKKPYGLAWSNSGDLLVLDCDFKGIQVTLFDKNGYYKKSYPFEMSSGFGKPPRAAKCRFLDTYNNHLIVTDLGLNKVYINTIEGKLVKEFGSLGDKPGDFVEPSGVSVDGCGNLVIADSKNNRIQVYKENGDYACSVFLNKPGLNRPSDICLTKDGYLLVSNLLGHAVKIYQIEAYKKQ